MKAFIFFYLSSLALAAQPSLQQVDFTQNLGADVRGTRGTFTDESGKSGVIANYLGAHSTVLLLEYASCPNLCNLVINGLIKTLREIPLKAAPDLSVVVLSIDPQEAIATLKSQKQTFMQRYGAGSEQSVHFLKGTAAGVSEIASRIGFHYFFDPVQNQYAHPSGFVVLNSDGAVAQYFLGISFDSAALTAALHQATHGLLGARIQDLLLYCFHYDPETPGYGSLIMSMMRGFSICLLLAVGALAYWRHKHV